MLNIIFISVQNDTLFKAIVSFSNDYMKPHFGKTKLNEQGKKYLAISDSANKYFSVELQFCVFSLDLVSVKIQLSYLGMVLHASDLVIPSKSEAGVTSSKPPWTT